MSKPKVCKGQGRAKDYGCGAIQDKRIYGLGLLCGCYAKWLYNSPEGKALVDSRRLKAHKDVTNKKKAESREAKQKMKSIARLINDARVVFHKYIRTRDINLPCISCGSHSDLVDAGHYKKAELYRGTIFNELNVNGQCRKCNRYLGGNESAYREGLVSKYGEDKVKALETLAQDTKSYPWTREEIEEIRQEYKRKIKEL